MKAEFRPAAGLIVLIMALLIEQNLRVGQDMETPAENTVTAFEIEEHGLSVVLTNAIEDQRAVVENLTKAYDEANRNFAKFAGSNWPNLEAHWSAKTVEISEMKFRAMRVLGLLEATREREAGQVT